MGIRVIPLREQLAERVQRGIIVLWGAIAGVLLMACLNTAGLMMGRTSSRQKEIAVRLSPRSDTLAVWRGNCSQKASCLPQWDLCWESVWPSRW